MADDLEQVPDLPSESDRTITDPIVITLHYTQSLQGPTIRVMCEQEIWPDVLVDILQRAARFQERELIVGRLIEHQRQQAAANANAAAQLARHLNRRKN